MTGCPMSRFWRHEIRDTQPSDLDDRPASGNGCYGAVTVKLRDNDAGA
jgi:hypothetical protein